MSRHNRERRQRNDKVLQELVNRQHEIARSVHGGRFVIGDEELAATLLHYYGICPICKSELSFKPRIAVNLCESARHFIHLYGWALDKHYDSSPECKGKLEMLADCDDPRVRNRLDAERSKITDEDYRRWKGNSSPTTPRGTT